MIREEMRWECIHCNSIMDRTNFTDFIKQSDNDKNSNQEARATVGVYYQISQIQSTQIPGTATFLKR
jgi:hypothetical protein